MGLSETNKQIQKLELEIEQIENSPWLDLAVQRRRVRKLGEKIEKLIGDQPNHTNREPEF